MQNAVSCSLRSQDGRGYRNTRRRSTWRILSKRTAASRLAPTFAFSVLRRPILFGRFALPLLPVALLLAVAGLLPLPLCCGVAGVFGSGSYRLVRSVILQPFQTTAAVGLLQCVMFLLCVVYGMPPVKCAWAAPHTMLQQRSCRSFPLKHILSCNPRWLCVCLLASLQTCRYCLRSETQTHMASDVLATVVHLPCVFRLAVTLMTLDEERQSPWTLSSRCKSHPPARTPGHGHGPCDYPRSCATLPSGCRQTMRCSRCSRRVRMFAPTLQTPHVHTRHTHPNVDIFPSCFPSFFLFAVCSTPNSWPL